MNEQLSHIAEQVKTTVCSRSLFGKGADLTTPSAPLVLMVSGGSDSVALVYLMTRLYPALTKNFTIVHINHMLRGEVAYTDESFVCLLAQELGLPCIVKRVDVAALAAAGACALTRNIEHVGREERYRVARAVLDTLCDEAKIDRAKGRIITAHTLDDRAETFLMRCVVGAGVTGLRSIPYQNDRVIRPLLDCARADLRIWLVSEGILWREDETNTDTTYLRAFIRHEVLARMAKRNPAILQTLKRTMDILADEDNFLDEQARALEARFITYDDAAPGAAPDDKRHDDKKGNAALIVSTALFDEPPPLTRRVVRTVCNRVMPTEQRVTFEHIEAIVTKGASIGFALTLPGNIEVRNEYGTVRFTPKKQENVRTSNVDLGAGYTATVINTQDLDVDFVTYAKTHATPTTIFIDADKLLLGKPCFDKFSLEEFSEEFFATKARRKLQIRSLRNGDRFYPLGMNGHQKLVSDVLIDRKIPARLRNRVKALCANDEIVWLVGIQQDERYKVTEKTTTIVRIVFNGDNNNSGDDSSISSINSDNNSNSDDSNSDSINSDTTEGFEQ